MLKNPVSRICVKLASEACVHRSRRLICLAADLAADKAELQGIQCSRSKGVVFGHYLYAY